MWRILILITALAAALPALAQESGTPLDAAGFDALTRGKTFYYHLNGKPYGAEEYLPNNRVRWSFLGSECKDGSWYEDGGMICFTYTDAPDPQCWTFSDGPRGMIARFRGDPAATTLYEVRQSREPLFCPGPEIGV